MNKQPCTESATWYNEGVHRAITALDEKYPNAIAIFGGALSAYNYVNCDNPDFKQFALYLPNVINNSKLYQWHEGVIGALRRFCRLCLVDPYLVELYIGMLFEEVN